MRAKGVLIVSSVLCSLLLGSASWACRGHWVNPVTDISWRCLFPLSVGAAVLTQRPLPDTPNPASPVCACAQGDIPKVGLAVGFWEPVRLVEVVREPFCFPTLGGLSIPLGVTRGQGRATPGGTSVYHVHVIRYPLLSLLDLLTEGACGDPPTMDVPYLSELDPSWQDDALSVIKSPESLLFASRPLQTLCATDCAAATAHLPLNHLVWCAGCQGSLYPFTGHVAAHIGGVQGALLLAERAVAQEHRLLRLWEASGTTLGALCHKRPQPVVPKNQYRLAMVYPKPATKVGCLPFGRSSVTWEAGHEYPVTGEDFAYVVWRKRNCCAF